MNLRNDMDLFVLGALGVAAYLLYQKILSPTGSLNPANPNNIVNTAANSVYQGVTGSQGSIGTDAWDFFNPTQSAIDNGITSPSGALPDWGIDDTLNWDAPGSSFIQNIPMGAI